MNIESHAPKTSTVCLGAIKFFGAFIVAFIWHYQHFQPAAGDPLGRFFAFSYPYGWLMVELFFMLSGFGMMLGYGNKILSHTISFAPYIKKRIAKIYPLFFVTLVLVTFLELIITLKTGMPFVYPNFDLYHLLLNVVLCQDGLFVTDWSFNSPSWCISICFILYVIFFAVFHYSKDTKSAVIKFVILGLLGFVLLSLEWNYPIFNKLVARGLLCFSIGVILAYFYQNEHLLNTRFIGGLCCAGLILCYGAYRAVPEAIGDIVMLFILFVAPMIIVGALFTPWLNKLLSIKPLVYLGSLSMQIYLFHFPVQCMIFYLDRSYNLGLNYSQKSVWLLYVVITLAVSILYKQLFATKVTNLFCKVCKRFMSQN